MRDSVLSFYATVIFLKSFNTNGMSCVLNVIKTCNLNDNLCDIEHSNINL